MTAPDAPWSRPDADPLGDMRRAIEAGMVRLPSEHTIWETCMSCHREFAYPHLCREHLFCGLCHPGAHDRKDHRG